MSLTLICLQHVCKCVTARGECREGIGPDAKCLVLKLGYGMLWVSIGIEKPAASHAFNVIGMKLDIVLFRYIDVTAAVEYI